MKIVELIAETTKLDPGKINNMPHDSATDILAGALNTIYFLLGAVAVIVIILAGYTFSTSVYDPVKITKAKNAILYALVGLIIVIFAFATTQFIMRRF